MFADVAGRPNGTFVDVFEDDGRYLGRLDLPTPVSFFPFPQPLVAHATAEHLYVVVLDDDDVPYVSRLRIIGGRRIRRRSHSAGARRLTPSICTGSSLA